MKYFTEDIVDGNSLTLKEFLDILLNGKYLKLYPNNCFPSNEMLDEFLMIIKDIPDTDIKKIVYRFLIHEGTYGTNDLHKKCMLENNELLKSVYRTYPIYTNRLLLLEKPWEGLTWLLDLLPHYPKDVISVLNSFFKLYCQLLPDNVMFGLSNIDQIIRAKYFEFERPIDVLYNLTPNEFEYLIAELYKEMGYEVELTKKTHDDGIDIIARNEDIAKKEMIIIQCKKHRDNIEVKYIRELFGVIEINNATKGVFCTTGDYTPSSKKMLKKSNRLELLNGKEILKLCNEHLETNWPIKIGTISHMYQKTNIEK